jgi:GH25 family lysozyme M1 (1,4-beta-N-acetylmuramidase)
MNPSHWHWSYRGLFSTLTDLFLDLGALMAAIDAVVDISHHHGPNLDFQKAKAAGILGVIHKVTQGHSSIDPMYAANKKKALKAGLLWGAYHFATGADRIGHCDRDRFNGSEKRLRALWGVA